MGPLIASQKEVGAKLRQNLFDLMSGTALALGWECWPAGQTRELWGNQSQLVQTWPEEDSDRRNDFANLIYFADEHNEFREEQPRARVTRELRGGAGVGNAEPAPTADGRGRVLSG